MPKTFSDVKPPKKKSTFWRDTGIVFVTVLACATICAVVVFVQRVERNARLEGQLEGIREAKILVEQAQK